MTPRLSVVIPTLGRATLVPTLRSLIQCDGSNELEIVVAGQIPEGPVLKTLQDLRASHPFIRHLPVSFASGDSSEKKNAGARAAVADIVAFLDDDVVVARDWPDRILAPFNDPSVGLVSGPGLVPEDIPWFARLAGITLASKAAGYVSERYLQSDAAVKPIRWSRIIGCNMAYRKKVLEEIGWFDPKFWPGEEMIAAFKAEKRRYRLLFNSEARVYHYPRQSFLRFMKQIYGYGATRIRLFRGGAEFEPTTVVPAVWVLFLIIFGIGAFFCPYSFWTLVAGLGLYALADLWVAVDKFRETRRPGDLCIFFLVPFMHLAYGIAEWIEFFRPNQDLSMRTTFEVQ